MADLRPTAFSKLFDNLFDTSFDLTSIALVKSSNVVEDVSSLLIANTKDFY